MCWSVTCLSNDIFRMLMIQCKMHARAVANIRATCRQWRAAANSNVFRDLVVSRWGTDILDSFQEDWQKYYFLQTLGVTKIKVSTEVPEEKLQVYDKTAASQGEPISELILDYKRLNWSRKKSTILTCGWLEDILKFNYGRIDIEFPMKCIPDTENMPRHVGYFKLVQVLGCKRAKCAWNLHWDRIDIFIDQ